MKEQKPIKILAIETSCDETAAAVICDANYSRTFNIQHPTSKQIPITLSSVVSSQIDLHAITGGVVPEIASRAHVEAIIPVIEEALFLASSKYQNQDRWIPVFTGMTKKETWMADKTNIQLSEITHIAVTVGPGLVGSLLVGVNTAKALAYYLNIPIIPINHIEGHIYSAFSREISNSKFLISNQIPNPKSQIANKSKIQNSFVLQDSCFEFPILSLTVSGGHTSLTLMKDHGVYETIGQTVDDAAGEAFDKVAKLLGLSYPGGPEISKLAEKFRNNLSLSSVSSSGFRRGSVSPRLMTRGSRISDKPLDSRLRGNDKGQTGNSILPIIFPRPMMKDGTFNFSFSGLKTAVLHVVRDYSSSESASREVVDSSRPALPAGRQARTISWRPMVAAAFEDAVVDVLVTKTLKAAKKYQPKSIILAGGVAANKRLREELSHRLKTLDLRLLLPPSELCGDNAVMIGLAAYYHIQKNQIKNWNQIKIDSNLKL